MGILTLIQIPFHHVLANEISLNLKYCIGLKQIFNINLGIGIINKTTFFVSIFDTSPCFLLQFWSREIPLCKIKFHIQRLPTRHSFDRPRYTKNKKYLKKRDDDVLVGCGIKFRIQRVPSWHTFDGPSYPKNNKYLKKCDDDTLF